MKKMDRLLALWQSLRKFSYRGLLLQGKLRLSETELFVAGDCGRCGACCRSLSLEGPDGWLRSATTFAGLVRSNPEYERFILTGRDGQGYLLFTCCHLSEDGLCGDYSNRPAVCRGFPHKDLLLCGGELPTGCHYQFVEKRSFSQVLDKKIKKQAGGEFSSRL
ncbi:YkgJ family cysteine cluster protein [Desulfotalea psychrophila]|uniref:YkgJ family cysteine cluster protein n=1 Tax=Desulfotalea psychrophila (strain LSv54 / DSM 12343) TaxID=177439 RepID=Q6AK69_DESPS|nr:YkgJ family cysteine cluster protein [Desulfotalea psychrophila]CAG37257.1 hypothetical protein DP2528 [Desulfotalea psychrophila LSv54]